jgi:hypothetical protein
VKKGATVSAVTSGLTDVDGGIAGLAYQWQTSTDGTTWSAISGATASSFAIPNDFTYVGSYLRVTATTTDAYGGTTAFESSASLVGALQDDLFYVSNNTSGVQVSFDALLANDVGLNGADIMSASIIVGGNISSSLAVNTVTRMISFDTSGSTSDAILEYTVAGGDTARVTVKAIQTTGSGENVSLNLTGSYAGSYIDLKNGADTAISGGAVAYDTFLGGAGNDTLSGGNAVDKISGGAGDDRITGGASSDALTGGADHDTFVFNTPLAGAGIDTISDFDATNPSAGHDFIELSSSLFGVTASGGLLSSSQFVSLPTASSSYTSGTAKIVYDQATGNLYYDANGSAGGLADALVFATLTNKPTAMDATDIMVV